MQVFDPVTADMDALGLVGPQVEQVLDNIADGRCVRLQQLRTSAAPHAFAVVHSLLQLAQLHARERGRVVGVFTWLCRHLCRPFADDPWAALGGDLTEYFSTCSDWESLARLFKV